MHILHEVSGIETADRVVNWLKKESVTSITDLLLMGSGGLEATGWPLEEVERRAFECLCLWWGTNTASGNAQDLNLFMELTRDEFQRFVVQTQLDSARKKIKEGSAATSTPQISVPQRHDCWHAGWT